MKYLNNVYIKTLFGIFAFFLISAVGVNYYTKVQSDARYNKVADNVDPIATGLIYSKDSVSTNFARKASPHFTGVPTAPNPAGGTNNTQIATTAFVNSLIQPDFVTMLNNLGFTDIKGIPLGYRFTYSLATQTLVDGQLYLVLQEPETTSKTITGIKAISGTPGQGNYTADNFNGAGLYRVNFDGTYTLVATSANDATPLKVATSTTMLFPFTSPYSLTAGTYVAALLYNASGAATTTPALVSCSSITSSVLTKFTSANVKINSYIATQTALPNTVTVSGTSELGSTLLLTLY